MEKNEKKIGLLVFPNIITEQWGLDHRLWAKFDNSDQCGVSEILFAKIRMEQHPKKVTFLSIGRL